MIRIYCAALFCVAIFLSFLMGGYVGNARCLARAANASVNQIITDNIIVGETNETVLHTGVSDVRRILREKYTIAD